jgi:hypothetical protein
VIGPVRGEVSQALQLVGHLSKDMLVLADRGFDANAFIRAVHQAQAALVLRVCSSRKPTVLRVLHDGSYLSVIAGIPVRIITATVVVTCADGSILHMLIMWPARPWRASLTASPRVGWAWTFRAASWTVRSHCWARVNSGRSSVTSGPMRWAPSSSP